MERARPGTSGRLKTLCASALSALLLTVTGASGAPLTMDSYHNVMNLTQQIQWHTGLPQAEEEAKREHKLVFWMHMLGDLTGAT